MGGCFRSFRPPRPLLALSLFAGPNYLACSFLLLCVPVLSPTNYPVPCNLLEEPYIAHIFDVAKLLVIVYTIHVESRFYHHEPSIQHFTVTFTTMKFLSLCTTVLFYGQTSGFVRPSASLRSSAFVTNTLDARSSFVAARSCPSTFGTSPCVLRMADAAESIPLKESSTTPSSPNQEEPNNDEQISEKDPIGLLFTEAQDMDANAIINSAVLIAVVLSVLMTFTTVDSNIMRGWSVEEMAYRIPFDNWEAYSAVLARSPVETKAVTSATVYTIGDIISQFTEGSTIGKLDRMRILRSLAAGLIGHGPLSHLWYNWSDDIFENVLHWTEWWSFFPKVIVDQTTWGPFWNNTYILLLGLMKFESLESIWSDMKRTTVPLIVSGLKLWPLAHCVTYGLVPVENRLLWVDLVEIIWVTILATQASGVPATEAHAIEAEEKEQAEAVAATKA